MYYICMYITNLLIMLQIKLYYLAKNLQSNYEMKFIKYK